MSEQNTDVKSLAHTKWNCKYHIVFTPKYRRQVIYKQISADIGQIKHREPWNSTAPCVLC